MFKLKFIDVLNSAIAEFYGENAVQLLKVFSSLNQKGQLVILDHAEMCSAIPKKYSRSIKLAEQSVDDNKIIIQGE